MRKAKTTTTVVSLIAAALLALLITAMLTGCSEADKVNANISKQAITSNPSAGSPYTTPGQTRSSSRPRVT